MARTLENLRWVAIGIFLHFLRLRKLGETLLLISSVTEGFFFCTLFSSFSLFITERCGSITRNEVTKPLSINVTYKFGEMKGFGMLFYKKGWLFPELGW